MPTTSTDGFDDDPSLLSAFADRLISNDNWTHRLHVRVAYCYLRDRGLNTGGVAFVGDLRRLNAANAVPDAPRRGYHHTITMAWLALIAAATASDGQACDSLAFLDAHPSLQNSRLLDRHFSEGRLFCPEAKRGLVEPDRVGLPAPWPLDLAADEGEAG